MLTSFLWGFLAAATLIAGGAVALRWHVHERLLGMVMAFGSGVLICGRVVRARRGGVQRSAMGRKRRAGLCAGALTFFAGDALIDRMGGADRKRSGGEQAEGSALAIVLGIVLDGIPESIVLGLTIVDGGSVSVAFLCAVALSNVPEALSASSGLAQSGWTSRRILGLWTLVVARLRSGVARRLRPLRHRVRRRDVAFVLSFAAGAILTMLADTMMPEAFEHGGKLVGLVTTLGFGVAFAISALE